MQCTTLCTTGMTAMTKDDITRMAREAGFVGFDGDNKCLREFANLIAEAEREACAEVCEDHFAAGAAAERNVLKDRIDTLQKLYKQAIRQRDQLMNEQRAQVAAIRARGQL